MILILFFALLFTCFALSYLCFTLKYLQDSLKQAEIKKRMEQVVTIVESRVAPLNYKFEFLVPEYEVNQLSERRCKSQNQIAREFAAMRISSEIEKFILEDTNNQLFKLYLIDFPYYTLPQESKFCKHYELRFTLVPEYTSNYSMFAKLI